MNLFEIKFFHPCGWVWDSVRRTMWAIWTLRSGQKQKNCCLLNTQQAHFGLQAMNVFIKCFCLLSNLWRLFTEEVIGGGGIKSGPVVERKTKGEGRERYTMSSKECNLESLDKFDKTVMHFQISCRNEALTWTRHGSQRSQAWEHHESD